jgi:hypothetical protein
MKNIFVLFIAIVLCFNCEAQIDLIFTHKAITPYFRVGDNVYISGTINNNNRTISNVSNDTLSISNRKDSIQKDTILLGTLRTPGLYEVNNFSTVNKANPPNTLYFYCYSVTGKPSIGQRFNVSTPNNLSVCKDVDSLAKIIHDTLNIIAPTQYLFDRKLDSLASSILTSKDSLDFATVAFFINLNDFSSLLVTDSTTTTIKAFGFMSRLVDISLGHKVNNSLIELIKIIRNKPKEDLIYDREGVLNLLNNKLITQFTTKLSRTKGDKISSSAEMNDSSQRFLIPNQSYASIYISHGPIPQLILLMHLAKN